MELTETLLLKRRDVAELLTIDECIDREELFSDLVASSKIVVDLAEQSEAIGELHHAIQQELITLAGIHAELGQIIAGKKPGRESDKDIIIFDSTGTALQDVAAAAIVYEKSLATGIVTKLNFAEQGINKDAEVFKNNQRKRSALKSWLSFK